MLIVLLLVLVSLSSGAPLHHVDDFYMFVEASEESVDEGREPVGVGRKDELRQTEKSDDIERIGNNGEPHEWYLRRGKDNEANEDDVREENVRPVEIGEEGGRYYIILPKQIKSPAGLLSHEAEDVEMEEMTEDNFLFESDKPIKHREENNVEILDRRLEERIKAEDCREKQEDEREKKEEEREKNETNDEEVAREWKRNNHIEIEEGVDSYKILLPKQTTFGMIRVKSLIRGRKNPEKGGTIKGQGDGRGGHTIYRHDSGDRNTL